MNKLYKEYLKNGVIDEDNAVDIIAEQGKEIERLYHREKELKYFNDILENQNLDKAKVIKEVREYIEKYEVINGYYDGNYDGENDTYSHDLVKEDILEILDKEKEQ